MLAVQCPSPGEGACLGMLSAPGSPGHRSSVPSSCGVSCVFTRFLVDFGLPAGSYGWHLTYLRVARSCLGRGTKEPFYKPKAPVTGEEETEWVAGLVSIS